jgi:hypothetical protein
VNGIYHELQCGIDNGARLFRVEVLDQLHRALDVGEQRGDRLALALDRRRSIWLLRRDLNLGSGWFCRLRLGRNSLSIASQRGPAFAAEVLPGLIRRAALRTPAPKWSAAFRAEFAPFPVFISSLRAAHRFTLRASDPSSYITQCVTGTTGCARTIAIRPFTV